MLGKIVLSLVLITGSVFADEERPNILWITCEDISPYLGCYGFEQAHTPNLDRLASEGIRYTQAYAQAPVCAVARSTLLTGMYSSTIGTQHMRSHMTLPESIPAYPRLFRKAGYYCTNNFKKDYNSNLADDESLWDESSKTAHWKNRQPGQPFFAVFNFMETHEGQLQPERVQEYVKRKQIPAEPRINPADIKLPPYHPDLPDIRMDWARLHDLITHMDNLAGQRLKELEEAGEADNTIVFFYSDHGGMLSRSKRYLYDLGTRVPFIAYFPEKWKHLAPSTPGTTSDRLVSFIDFPKTVLSLAGIEVPEMMQGRCFMGPDTEPEPQTVHFTRDRMGDVYDFSRAVTDGRWFLTLNFNPHRPRGRDTSYGYTVQKNWGAWRDAYDAGLCNEVQSQFFSPKPAVELFDTLNDPFQITNLADDPECREHVTRLQQDLEQWMIETRDTGLIPEPMFYDLAGPGKKYSTLYEYAQSEEYPVERLLSVALSARQGDSAKCGEYLEGLKDPYPAARYWNAYGLFLAGVSSPEILSGLRAVAADDAIPANRIMAAQALAVCGDRTSACECLLREFRKTNRTYVALLAVEALKYGKLADLLTPKDWTALEKKEIPWSTEPDNTQDSYRSRAFQMLRSSVP